MLKFLVRVLAIILYLLFWFMIGWILGYGITAMSYRGSRKATLRATHDDYVAAGATPWIAK